MLSQLSYRTPAPKTMELLAEWFKACGGTQGQGLKSPSGPLCRLQELFDALPNPFFGAEVSPMIEYLSQNQVETQIPIPQWEAAWKNYIMFLADAPMSSDPEVNLDRLPAYQVWMIQRNSTSSTLHSNLAVVKRLLEQTPVGAQIDLVGSRETLMCPSAFSNVSSGWLSWQDTLPTTLEVATIGGDTPLWGELPISKHQLRLLGRNFKDWVSVCLVHSGLITEGTAKRRIGSLERLFERATPENIEEKLIPQSVAHYVWAGNHGFLNWFHRRKAILVAVPKTVVTHTAAATPTDLRQGVLDPPIEVDCSTPFKINRSFPKTGEPVPMADARPNPQDPVVVKTLASNQEPLLVAEPVPNPQDPIVVQTLRDAAKRARTTVVEDDGYMPEIKENTAKKAAVKETRPIKTHPVMEVCEDNEWEDALQSIYMVLTHKKAPSDPIQCLEVCLDRIQRLRKEPG